MMGKAPPAMDSEERNTLEGEFGRYTDAELNYRILRMDGIDPHRARFYMQLRQEESHLAAIRRAGEALEIARSSAEASRRSARYSMWASIIAAVAILVTVVRDFILLR